MDKEDLIVLYYDAQAVGDLNHGHMELNKWQATAKRQPENNKLQ